MFNKDRIAIDITSEKISILVGTTYKIVYSCIIETPIGAYVDDKIEDIEAIKSAIELKIGKSKFGTKSKDAYFIVRGDDTIVRHITLPNMKEDAVKDSVEWELTQFVGDRADEYYISYEVLTKKEKESQENIDILMVAGIKTKIDKYVELANLLKLNIKGLDVASNAGARVIRSCQQVFTSSCKTVGVIDIGADYSSLFIVERGKLQMDKYFTYGINTTEGSGMRSHVEYSTYLDSIDLYAEDSSHEELQNNFTNINSQFNGVIQYYSSGKVKKTLDKIYVLGSATSIAGYNSYIEESFNTIVSGTPSFNDIKFVVKTGKRVNLKDFYYNYGLILSNGKNGVDLVPTLQIQKEVKSKGKQSAILLGILVVLILAGGFGAVKAGGVLLKNQEKELTETYKNSALLIEQAAKLKGDILLVNQHISKSSQVETLKSKGTDVTLKELSSEFPAGIKAIELTYTRNEITLSGKAQSQQQVEELWANLRENENFSKSHISSIGVSAEGIVFELKIVLG